MIDTTGAACSSGEEAKNHVNLFLTVKNNPVSTLLVCSSDYRLNKVIQDELRFCLLIFGPQCFKRMIFVITQTKAIIGEDLIADLNYDKDDEAPEITIESLREELEDAIQKFVRSLPGVTDNLRVPVVFFDSFTLRQQRKEDELVNFYKEAYTLAKFIVNNSMPMPFAEKLNA